MWIIRLIRKVINNEIIRKLIENIIIIRKELEFKLEFAKF